MTEKRKSGAVNKRYCCIRRLKKFLNAYADCVAVALMAGWPLCLALGLGSPWVLGLTLPLRLVLVLGRKP